MPKGTYRAICDILEIEYSLDITNEVMPMLAEFNDKFEIVGIGLVVGLLPSRRGTRIVFLHIGDLKK